MQQRIFQPVWYRPFQNKWEGPDFFVAMRDSGKLVIEHDKLIYSGKMGEIVISDIHRVSYGRQGRDWVNKWVRIAYGDKKVAYFADGGNLGWRGLFGGTREIYRVVSLLAVRMKTR